MLSSMTLYHDDFGILYFSCPIFMLSPDYKRNARGFSDFDYTRNRILWATRENPSVKGIPRSKEEIKTNEGKERGPYKKKKQSSSK